MKFNWNIAVAGLHKNIFLSVNFDAQINFEYRYRAIFSLEIKEAWKCSMSTKQLALVKNASKVT